MIQNVIISREIKKNYLNCFQLGLLDFGATREYKEDFVRNYFNILDGAANNQPSQVLDYSIKLGFLTGYESKVMMDAHVESVMILATPFREDRIFDYGNQNTTSRMHELMAVMLEHRLCPPRPPQTGRRPL